MDNALDAGAEVSLDHADGAWIVTDDGPGLDPAEVPRLFAVNRPLLSSKLVRLPLRGMLGNGLRVVAGAVAATDGSLVVETRGRRLTLAVCRQTGRTTVASDEPVPPRPGVTVRLSLGHGRSRRRRAGARLHRRRQAAGRATPARPRPGGTAARTCTGCSRRSRRPTPRSAPLCRSLGLELDDDRPARDLGRDEAEAVLARLRAGAEPVPPERLGFIGKECRPDWPGYARKTGTTTTQAGARIPYVVEAWAVCSRPAQKGQGQVRISLLVNRSMTAATIHADSWPGKIAVRGCGLHRWAEGPGTGDYAGGPGRHRAARPAGDGRQGAVAGAVQRGDQQART